MAKASGSFTEVFLNEKSCLNQLHLIYFLSLLQRLRHCITPVNHSKSSTLVSSDCKNVRLSSINSGQTNDNTVYV